MSPFRSISLLGLTSLLAAALGFLVQVMLARHLGTTDYGVLAAVMAAINLVTPVSTFGLGALLLQVFGEEGWSGSRWVGPLFKLYVGINVALIVGAIGLWSWHSGAGHGYAWAALIVLGQSAIELLQARFQLEERYQRVALWQALPNIGRVIVAFICVNLGLAIEPILFGFAVMALAGSVYAFARIVPLARARFVLIGHGERSKPTNGFRGDVPTAWHVAIRAWPFALSPLFFLVYMQSDVVLIGWLLGSADAGIYNVAYGVMLAVYLLPWVVYQKYLMPKNQRWSVHDQARFLATYRAGNRYMLVLGVAVMGVVMLLGDRFVVLVFGVEYARAGSVLTYLALCVPLRFLALSAGSVLVAKEHVGRRVRYEGLAAAVNLGLNLALLPLFGLPGAVASKLLAELLLLMCLLFGAHRYVLSEVTASP